MIENHQKLRDSLFRILSRYGFSGSSRSMITKTYCNLTLHIDLFEFGYQEFPAEIAIFQEFIYFVLMQIVTSLQTITAAHE